MFKSFGKSLHFITPDNSVDIGLSVISRFIFKSHIDLVDSGQYDLILSSEEETFALCFVTTNGCSSDQQQLVCYEPYNSHTKVFLRNNKPIVHAHFFTILFSLLHTCHTSLTMFNLDIISRQYEASCASRDFQQFLAFCL